MLQMPIKMLGGGSEWVRWKNPVPPVWGPRKKRMLDKDKAGWFQKARRLYRRERTREWWGRGRSWGSFCGSLSLGRPLWRARGWVCWGRPSEDFGGSSQGRETGRGRESGATEGPGGRGGASYRQREGDAVTDTREAGPEGLKQRGTLTRLTPDCHLHTWCKNAFH